MKKEEVEIDQLFDVTHTIAQTLLSKYKYPWEVLPEIRDFINLYGSTFPEKSYKKIGSNIWIHNSVKIPPTVCLGGPLIICEGAVIRNGAFFRGNVIVGSKAVVGNSCEIKNSILFDEAQIPHFSYVGDSIIGYKSHLGASSITSNLKSDQKPVKVHLDDENIETNLKKFGAMVGDMVEVGCGSILNPGTIIGKNTTIYPLSSIRGCIAADSIYKKEGNIVKKH